MGMAVEIAEFEVRELGGVAPFALVVRVEDVAPGGVFHTAG